MNQRTYIIPGLKSWIFKTSTTGYELYSELGGLGVVVTPDTLITEIASRVKGVLWLRFRMTDEAAEKAAKAVLIIDWQAMIQEAGTNIQHQSPSLPGWTLKISDSNAGLWHSSGEKIYFTADTPPSEIADGVRRVLQHSSSPAETDAAVNEVMRIDFKNLITNAWAPKVAPLLAGCTADNTALIEAICADVRLLASMQRTDSTAQGNEICALVSTLA